ncbi:MAG: hypothetical protein WDK95_10480 [Syntrophorhabdaceae bacterium]
MDSKDFSKQAKEMILLVSNLVQSILNNPNNPNISKESNSSISYKIFEKIDTINAEIDKMAKILEKNDIILSSNDLNYFATGVYSCLIQELTNGHQLNGLMLSNILAMIKLVAFVSFEAGKIGLEDTCQNMLNENGFEEELKAGFDVKKWAQIIKENEC